MLSVELSTEDTGIEPVRVLPRPWFSKPAPYLSGSLPDWTNYIPLPPETSRGQGEFVQPQSLCRMW